MEDSRRPVIVIVPGAGQTPSHYAFLQHLLQGKGYPTFCTALPSVGAAGNSERDVVIVSHSYGALPASAAAQGLSKSERAESGKRSLVLGQIFVTTVLARGGDGKTLLEALGGQIPPFMKADEPSNLIHCAEPVSAFYHASWASGGYVGRCAYVRAERDKTISLQMQNKMIEGTGTEWILEDIDSDHSPQLSHPEKLADMIA